MRSDIGKGCEFSSLFFSIASEDLGNLRIENKIIPMKVEKVTQSSSRLGIIVFGENFKESKTCQGRVCGARNNHSSFNILQHKRFICKHMFPFRIATNHSPL